ncbi:M20 family metallopeptidase [Ornithinimicrobium sediminis]|uniref:M20 family metallopeptidase n=1 Tax=Ornithinimicrobium sediminis TaxID=2904603 RepID=UPI001E3946D1|nr:M20 family metallopeptidase [Ornithinimicrobium sediminis]MCE0486579.1 M20 family metallopeptidase [Ornithinimicrobium sediminis]
MEVRQDTLSDLERRVLALVDADDLVAMTRRLVQAPGQNPPGDEAATADVLVDLAVGAGLEAHAWDVRPGRPNVEVVLPGGGGPGLLVLGHTDVVPVGDGWSLDPFGGEVRDGRLHGRGSSDMKGGLAAALVAMRALRAADVRPSGPVLLAALADEEQEGIGVREWIARRPRHDLLGCLVAEPTDLQTIVAARGACYLVVTVHGVAAHAGRPGDGRNAIHGAAAVVAEVERWHAELARSPHPLVGPPTFNVGVITGGTGGSVVPAECRVEVDRRLLPGESIASVVEAVQARLASLRLDERGLSWTLESPMDMPGFETQADHPVVVATDRALADAGGPGLPLGGWTAACDGGFVDAEWGLPVVVLGPGSVSDQAHRPDESVGVDELVVAARAYALAALRLLTP